MWKLEHELLVAQWLGRWCTSLAAYVKSWQSPSDQLLLGGNPSSCCKPSQFHDLHSYSYRSKTDKNYVKCNHTCCVYYSASFMCRIIKTNLCLSRRTWLTFSSEEKIITGLYEIFFYKYDCFCDGFASQSEYETVDSLRYSSESKPN